MGTAKIQVGVGRVTFSGEGSEPWLAKQLDKVLEATKSTRAEAPDDDGEDEKPAEDEPEDEAGNGASGKNGKNGPLATYLRNNNATENQTRKFMATAAWLGKARWTQ